MRQVRERLKGSIPALITPMKRGQLDEGALRSLIAWQIAEGSHGLVPCGTTGESPTLTNQEHRRVIEICVQEANGRVPVLAGAGSNCTAEAIDLAKAAKDAGADAVLSVTGYYNKPSQEGLYHHLATLAEEVQIPIVLYNIPSRAVVDVAVETMARLSKIENIAGVKDATGNLSRPTRERLACGKEWLLLSGDDASALGYMAHGGHGCISVTANVAPRLCSEFQEACMRGDFAAARALHERLMPLHEGLFCEPSPAPAKFAASLLGLCHNELRAPMMPLTDAGQAKVRDAMIAAGLL
ncbi:MAG TPA: 4-hydroxy-tetrahydrodipicolinate synthase [Rhizomicrobium sp.]|nr:4-hydroxy-tetrahydrodipicolinate synthase [Rhizomicrobium sp.]